MRRAILVWVLFLAGTSAPRATEQGGGADANQVSVVPQPVGSQAWQRYVEDGWDSPFGLDYVFVLAQQLGGFVGVRWVNFARVNWGEIEPRAPVGGKHAYHWAALDEGMRQWQQQGVHVMMSLRFVSPDMPGLLFPVLHYQVCNEAYNELFWAGTVEEYGMHLKEVAQAARQACPKVKIIHCWTR